MTRIYRDPPDEERCTATIRLADGTTARCGRRATDGQHCWQHKANDLPHYLAPKESAE